MSNYLEEILMKQVREMIALAQRYQANGNQPKALGLALAAQERINTIKALRKMKA